MRIISRRKPIGSKPAPVEAGGQKSLAEIMGKDVEIYLQSEPYMRDEQYIGRLLYATSSWLGVVHYYRSQLFYDHIPLTSIRKIRGALLASKKINEEPYKHIDYDNPETVTDLIGKEVVVLLQGHPQLTDSGFRTRLIYVKKRWVGTSSTFSQRILPDHIPLTSVRKISKVVLIGRHEYARKA